MFMIGFAAETRALEKHARAKLKKKRLDLIAANLVGNGRAFDRDDNRCTSIGAAAARPSAKARNPTSPARS